MTALDNPHRAVLREFVQENFLYMRPNFTFSDDDSLLARGIIDSLGVMELVGFVESRWDLTVEAEDITAANFGTIGSLARYVAARMADDRLVERAS